MDRSTGPGRLLSVVALVCASTLPTGCTTAARSAVAAPSTAASPVAHRTDVLSVPSDPVRTLATAYGPADTPSPAPAALRRHPRPAAPQRRRRRPPPTRWTPRSAPGLAALCALAAQYPGWPSAARQATGC
jgi:hypothetical protein